MAKKERTYTMPDSTKFDVWYSSSLLRSEDGRQVLESCRKYGFGLKLVDQSIIDYKLAKLKDNPERFVRSSSGNMAYIQKDA